MTTLLEPRRVPQARWAAAAAAEGSSSVAAPERLTIAESLLDGGEIVLLAIKPSLWFVLFDSARWILFGTLLLVVSFVPTLQVAGLSNRTVAQLACLIIGARMVAALLRWVSRFYVLTNRRVMRLCGVLRADILSCPLLAIRNTRVGVGPHERLTGLGTILFVSEEMPGADLHWHEIARCDEVHAMVRRAIERAIDEQPH